MILVDSCVIIDVLENDGKWADWSQTRLDTWGARGPLLINPVIYAELAAYARSKESLEAEIATAGLLTREMPRDALFLAGRACRVPQPRRISYRGSCGLHGWRTRRRRRLPAAHA